MVTTQQTQQTKTTTVQPPARRSPDRHVTHTINENGFARAFGGVGVISENAGGR